jgi:hypothetical protein
MLYIENMDTMIAVRVPADLKKKLEKRREVMSKDVKLSLSQVVRALLEKALK